MEGDDLDAWIHELSLPNEFPHQFENLSQFDLDRYAKAAAIIKLLRMERDQAVADAGLLRDLCNRSVPFIKLAVSAAEDNHDDEASQYYMDRSQWEIMRDGEELINAIGGDLK